MFRATMYPSSGEITVSIRHLVFVTLCAWPSGMQDMHTRRSSTQNDKYQMSYWYSYFSWWWAHSCPKHVENRYKHTKKEFCTRLVLFTRLYKDAQSTKHKIFLCVLSLYLNHPKTYRTCHRHKTCFPGSGFMKISLEGHELLHVYISTQHSLMSYHRASVSQKKKKREREEE
jgi:hypothetical protein